MAANGTYDRNLLQAAQAPTKAELQEGYNVDLLNQPRRPRPAAAPRSDFEHGSKENYIAPAPRPPFWKTRKGLIIIVVAVLLLAALVGGLAGGLSKRKKPAPKVAEQAPQQTAPPPTTAPPTPTIPGFRTQEPTIGPSQSISGLDGLVTAVQPSAT